jgi:hypothetical protein
LHDREAGVAAKPWPRRAGLGQIDKTFDRPAKLSAVALSDGRASNILQIPENFVCI